MGLDAKFAKQMKTRTNHGAVIPIGEFNGPRNRKPFIDPLVVFYGIQSNPTMPAAVKKYSPQPNPYHVLLEEAGHKLIRDENGKIDDDQLDEDIHNGPRCELCGKAWCIWCEDEPKPCSGAKQ